MSNTHGGKREGAGRPPLDPKERRERIFPNLPPSLRVYAEKIGRGNLSQGIVEAIEAYRRGMLAVQCGNESAHPATDDTYDGECPICGGFAIYWSPLDEYIKNPDAHYACENGHQK